VTGSNGKRADARNCFIILTTNLGSADAEKNTIGFGELEQTGIEAEAYKNFFAPEFRNRIDQVCTFGPLNDLAKRKVALKFIQELELQLNEKGLILSVDEASIDYILERGYNKRMGARPMARAVDNLLRKPIAKQLLVDKNINGCKIKIRNVNNNLLVKFRYTDGSSKEVGGSEFSESTSIND